METLANILDLFPDALLLPAHAYGDNAVTKWKDVRDHHPFLNLPVMDFDLKLFQRQQALPKFAQHEIDFAVERNLLCGAIAQVDAKRLMQHDRNDSGSCG